MKHASKTVSSIISAMVLSAGVLAVTSVPVRAMADETAKEKAQDAGNKMDAKGKKVVNRVKEAACAEGDAKCAAKKAGHRIDETGDSVSNKAKEIKNKAD